MEDIEEINGMNTQSETLRQLEILPTFFTNVVILKLGLILSPKSHTIIKEMHFG
jgi:hypothetical protein